MKKFLQAVVFAIVLSGAMIAGAVAAENRTRGVLLDSTGSTFWSAIIEARIASLHDSLATFGVRPDATEDYDQLYDVPRPPSPPGDYVEVYFPHTGGNWPNLLGYKFASDISTPVHPRWLMEIETTLGSGTMEVSWDSSALNRLPAGYTILLKDSLPGIVTNMRQTDRYTFSYDAVRMFVISIEFDAMFFNVNARWNLVSVPLAVADFSKSVVFPTSTSDAFEFNNGYIAQSVLALGKGYWLKFSTAQVVSVSGTATPLLDIPVRAGWNLIGTIDHAIPAPSGGLIISPWYGYINGYVVASALSPGRAYWVKCSGDGVLTLTGVLR